MMSNSLRDKIRSLVEEAYDLRKESVITKIEQLVEEEVALSKEEYKIGYKDLMLINSSANKHMTEMDLGPESLGKIHGDQSLIRTLCFTNSVVSFLRSKGLLRSLVSFSRNK